MRMTTGKALCLAAAAGAATLAAPAAAEPLSEVELKPLLDVRLRYAHVDQDRLARNADAVTARGRAGAEIASGDWSLLAEGEGTLALSEVYDSGLNGRTLFPIVADPQNLELNRLQLQYRGLPETAVTAGRQRITLDDHRFVGNVGWRQNEQTFDAVRIEYAGIEGLKADLSYAWSVHTIWGIDGTGTRQQAVSGDNWFANLGYATPIGTLSGFVYLVDQDEPAVAGYRLSSQTYELRFAGAWSLSPRMKLNYAVSYASQSDHHRNPQDYTADYFLLDGGLEMDALKIGLGYEVMGADGGRPLTSFQTPLATLHKFQGWADKFPTTPPDGVRDLYASAGYGWRHVAGVDSLEARVTWHRFRSDRLDLDYGREWDASLAARQGPWTATAKVAGYDARRFATDTTKVWLQLEWSY